MITIFDAGQFRYFFFTILGSMLANTEEEELIFSLWLNKCLPPAIPVSCFATLLFWPEPNMEEISRPIAASVIHSVRPKHSRLYLGFTRLPGINIVIGKTSLTNRNANVDNKLSSHTHKHSYPCKWIKQSTSCHCSLYYGMTGAMGRSHIHPIFRLQTTFTNYNFYSMAANHRRYANHVL